MHMWVCDLYVQKSGAYISFERKEKSFDSKLRLKVVGKSQVKQMHKYVSIGVCQRVESVPEDKAHNILNSLVWAFIARGREAILTAN